MDVLLLKYRLDAQDLNSVASNKISLPASIVYLIIPVVGMIYSIKVFTRYCRLSISFWKLIFQSLDKSVSQVHHKEGGDVLSFLNNARNKLSLVWAV